jgi:ABC-type sugar transport system ATPase subunit
MENRSGAFPKAGQRAVQGNGVVLVSSEFEELSGLADWVVIMRNGAVHGILDRWAGDDLSNEALSRAVQA